MNGPVLDPDKEESTMEALGMIRRQGLGWGLIGGF